MRILSESEAEEYTKKEFKRVSSHQFGIAQLEDEPICPYFVIQLPLKEDEDGGLWWDCHIEGTNSHFFIHIKLRNGEVVIPLCIVSPGHRKFAWALAKTTYLQKYNEKHATILIGNSQDKMYPITFDAGPLCTSLVMSKLLPPNALVRFASKYCPACKAIKKGAK